ncbi:hypothetical protein [Methylobacterium sp. W2]|nr:hypothetical protein [Methylobacterium sp. W2]
MGHLLKAGKALMQIRRLDGTDVSVDGFRDVGGLGRGELAGGNGLQ